MLIEARRQRLEELRRKHPLFAEVFDFYARLYDFFAVEKEVFLVANPKIQERELRRREGFPLLSSDRIEVDADRAAAFVGRLIAVLRRHGREGTEDLDTLQEALAAGAIDLACLFRACMDRDRRALAQAAEATGVQAAVLEFVLSTAFGFALKRCREAGLSVDPSGWEQGYCPLCGGLPVMGELAGVEGVKKLHCGTCATCWTHTRLKCSHCGNDEVDKLEYFTAEGDVQHRVNVCRKCSGYLKIVDSRTAGEDLPLDIEDIATLHLDMMAQKEGFAPGKKGGKIIYNSGD